MDFKTGSRMDVRASVNKWISDNFPEHRMHISNALVSVNEDGSHIVELQNKSGKNIIRLGEVHVHNDTVYLVGSTVPSLVTMLDELRAGKGGASHEHLDQTGNLYEFRFGNGIDGAARLENESVDLLLTDPPYSISKAYTCEGQVPRRMRNNGADFIMPRGHFGDWDDSFPPPAEWADIVIPKVRGWAVVFCAQAQIGEYCEIFERHKLVAVGPMVWHKTNPVPFNHRYKPINAWEAIVVGKQPGTKFNGHAVHNVFTCKSPSPQQRIHPTQKPLELVSQFVDLFSNPGDFVLDPFAGSATTVVAAVEKGRRVLAFESDPEIFDAASKRLDSLGMFA